MNAGESAREQRQRPAFPLLIAMVAVGCSTLSCGLDGPPFGSDGPYSGWAAYHSGDANGDGTGDFLLVTRFEPTGSDYGRVRLISGFDGSSLSNLDVPYWASVAWAGDVDGDRFGDVLAIYNNDLDARSGRNGDTIWSLAHDLGDLARAVGDIDGDGCEDILVGGFPPEHKPRKALSLISGKTRAILWTVSGQDTVHGSVPRPFAWNGCALDDVDGDGKRDVAVDTDQDQVRILSGRTGEQIRELSQRFEWSGALTCVGDLDHDGVPELAMRRATSSPVEIVSCATGRTLFEAEGTRAYVCRAVSRISDFDHDGVADLAVGTHALVLCSGADGRTLASRDGIEFSGAVVDADKDGTLDLVVVHNVYDAEAEPFGKSVWSAGWVEVLSGKDLSVLRRIDSASLNLTSGR